MSTMSVVSEQRRRQSRQHGGAAELRYVRASPGVRKASRDEDIHMHIDFWHDDQGVDVKGNNMPDEIWVEFKNVNGDHGWLFGEATSIAFDMPELAGFVVVDREELKDYCKEHVDFTEIVSKRDAYKRCYSRKDREDLITYLVLDDLQQLPSYDVVSYCSTYIHPETKRACSVFKKCVP